MATSIQARLDKETEHALEQLVRRLGWSPSKVVREGVRLLAACYVPKGRRTIIGQGKFRSGLGDLASNKAHLRDFGK
jgi:hypothetical protein